MMESADLGQRNDAALLGSLNGARVGRILPEGEMGAGPLGSSGGSCADDDEGVLRSGR